MDSRMNTQDCAWADIFDEQSRTNLKEGFIVTGAISALLSAWLNVALLFTNLRSDLSYRNLTFFTAVACARRAASVCYHLLPFNQPGSFHPLSKKLNKERPMSVSIVQEFFLPNRVWFSSLAVKSNDHGIEIPCDFFGFWDSFLAVYEVECLTHVCIERYVVAKYITRGWPIQKNHYILYQGLCVLFAALYSLPPLLGIGRYALDFSCQSCVLDMVLPGTWERFIVVAIFLLRSVKSTGFMITMLVWARNLESKYDNSENLMKEFKFTNSVIIVTMANLLCWLPIALIRGWVVLSYMLANDVQVKPCSTSIQWAVWIHWISPALTTIAMFLIDERAHQKMINICKGDGKIDADKKNE